MKKLWIALFTACLSLAFVGSAYSADEMKKDKAKKEMKKDETKKKKEKDKSK